MAMNSQIEWTQSTWNPVTGCTKISEGCANCYAERMAKRLLAMGQANYTNGFNVTMHPHVLEHPLKWKKPQTIFVNSMSDLFHQGVSDDYIRRVAAVMRAADWHTYQVLTKRPDRMLRLLAGPLRPAAKCSHIWWGVSVENRRHGLPRIDKLRDSGAAMKFLSIEPLLEDLGEFDLSGIDWVIVGGESGPRARPLHRDWVIRIRDLCATAGVPFFFKQWGGFQKSKHGRELDRRTYDEFPTMTPRSVPAKPERQRAARQWAALV